MRPAARPERLVPLPAPPVPEAVVPAPAPVPAPSHTLTFVPERDVAAPARAVGSGVVGADRVLPMGTGLILMGLGLGFIALRLRRR